MTNLFERVDLPESADSLEIENSVENDRFLEGDPFLEAELAALAAPIDRPKVEASRPLPGATATIDKHSDWFLGIDIGTTGISAVLLHQQRCQLYPIYWTDPLAALSAESDPEQQFRLPAIEASGELALQDWKPYLNVAVPHQSLHQGWEPALPWSESRSIALQQIVQATQDLLVRLRPAIDRLSTEAVGLELSEWQIALRSLAGVIVSCPADATAAYRSNIGTAVLGAGLVVEPEQIYFAEEAIAAFLSTLGSGGYDIDLAKQPSVRGQFSETAERQQGNTLILSAGATATELAIVSLPADFAELTAADFRLRSLPYAGTAIEQDILCQLFYPALVETLEPSSEWLAVFAGLSLPTAGEPDPANRDRFRQRLNASVTGQTLQQTARTLKLMLQQTSQSNVRLGDWQHPFLRQDLGSQVLLPYVQRLNRELNGLLAEVDLSVMQVNQVICTGGTASLGAIARWLRQKLPNATIIQDTYRPSANTSINNCISSCSRTAYGLAMLPLYPRLEGKRSAQI